MSRDSKTEDMSPRASLRVSAGQVIAGVLFCTWILYLGIEILILPLALCKLIFTILYISFFFCEKWHIGAKHETGLLFSNNKYLILTRYVRDWSRSQGWYVTLGKWYCFMPVPCGWHECTMCMLPAKGVPILFLLNFCNSLMWIKVTWITIQLISKLFANQAERIVYCRNGDLT